MATALNGCKRDNYTAQQLEQIPNLSRKLSDAICQAKGSPAAAVTTPRDWKRKIGFDRGPGTEMYDAMAVLRGEKPPPQP